MIESLGDCVPTKFDHQVAGHTNEMVRRFGPHCIIKPQNKVDLFRREVKFYEEIFNNPETTPKFFAKFYGLVDVEDENSGEVDGVIPKRPCIILQDMTLSYSQPSMIDIKIGRQTFEPSASTAKVERELRKYPHQNSIGFRITGMKVWNSTDQSYFSVDKWFGRSLEPSQVPLGLAAYFYDGVSFKTRVMEDTIKQLRKVLEWMEQQKRYKFFCSSILIVYDSNHNQNIGEVPNEYDEFCCRVNMIDFAHVCVNKEDEIEVDEGYIFGISSLISHIQSLIDISSDGESCNDFVNGMRSFLQSWPSK